MNYLKASFIILFAYVAALGWADASIELIFIN
jgi:hypothetical protein